MKEDIINYITGEQFLQQTKGIQEILINWWKPQYRDLVQGCYYGKEYDSNIIWCVGDVDMDYVKDDLKPIPLLSETQLRKFIMDNTGAYGSDGVLEILWDKFSYKIKISISDNYFYEFETYEKDILQTHWNVACQLAKQITEGLWIKYESKMY